MNLVASAELWLLQWGCPADQAFKEAIGFVQHLTQTVDQTSAEAFPHTVRAYNGSLKTLRRRQRKADVTKDRRHRAKWAGVFEPANAKETN